MISDNIWRSYIYLETDIFKLRLAEQVAAIRTRNGVDIDVQALEAVSIGQSEQICKNVWLWMDCEFHQGYECPNLLSLFLLSRTSLMSSISSGHVSTQLQGLSHSEQV